MDPWHPQPLLVRFALRRQIREAWPPTEKTKKARLAPAPTRGQSLFRIACPCQRSRAALTRGAFPYRVRGDEHAEGCAAWQHGRLATVPVPEHVEALAFSSKRHGPSRARSQGPDGKDLQDRRASRVCDDRTGLRLGLLGPIAAAAASSQGLQGAGFRRVQRGMCLTCQPCDRAYSGRTGTKLDALLCEKLGVQCPQGA